MRAPRDCSLLVLPSKHWLWCQQMEDLQYNLCTVHLSQRRLRNGAFNLRAYLLTLGVPKGFYMWPQDSINFLWKETHSKQFNSDDLCRHSAKQTKRMGFWTYWGAFVREEFFLGTRWYEWQGLDKIATWIPYFMTFSPGSSSLHSVSQTWRPLPSPQSSQTV